MCGIKMMKPRSKEYLPPEKLYANENHLVLQILCSLWPHQFVYWFWCSYTPSCPSLSSKWVIFNHKLYTVQNIWALYHKKIIKHVNDPGKNRVYPYKSTCNLTKALSPFCNCDMPCEAAHPPYNVFIMKFTFSCYGLL